MGGRGQAARRVTVRRPRSNALAPRRSSWLSRRARVAGLAYVSAVLRSASPAVAIAPTGISSARCAPRATAPICVPAASTALEAVPAAFAVVAPAVRAVLRALCAVSDAAPRVRRAEVLVAVALRFAAFRLRVAAARLAAAWRWTGV
jgi:hypothetical protein